MGADARLGNTGDPRLAADVGNPLSRRLRLAAKDWGHVQAVHDHLLEMVEHAYALERVTKRLLERLRDVWALDEGATMESDDIELERTAAALLGEGSL